ncbi:hypothetical protein VPHK356_0096 [Vibrio phage K356]|nr:heat-inducible transcription repressor [Vibrio phage 144E46.1]
MCKRDPEVWPCGKVKLQSIGFKVDKPTQHGKIINGKTYFKALDAAIESGELLAKTAGGELVGKVVGYERCGDTMSILLEPEKKLLKHIKQGWVGIWGSFQVKMYEDQTVDVESFTQYTITFTPPSKF